MLSLIVGLVIIAVLLIADFAFMQWKISMIDKMNEDEVFAEVQTYINNDMYRDALIKKLEEFENKDFI